MTVASNVSKTPWMQDTLREGFALLNRHRLKEASECCRRLLGAKPDLVEAHFLVGLIALEMNQTWTAVSAFGSVTKLDPKHGAAWAQLATLFMRVGQPTRADAALENATRFEDGNPLVNNLIGHVYTMLGDQQEARRWTANAVEAQPKNVPFLVNLANIHMFVGQIDDAESLLDRALAIRPDNANAHWVLASLRNAKDHSHVQRIEEILNKGERHPRETAFLYYALGKELEDLEEWDRAFDAFEAGAKERRATLDFDEKSEIEMFEALERICTAAWLSAQSPGHDDPSPIFVVGQPRSGTTLVERIITSHSQVHSAGELRQFSTCMRRLSRYDEPKRFTAKLVEGAATVDGEKLGKAYLATSLKMRGTLPRFVDKMPPNYRYIPLILKALPNAKIVHLRRNPMDACFASYKQLFADAYPHSYNQEEMARHHARYYHLMSAWRERFGDRLHEVAYEDIARDTEPHAHALIDYLELPWQDACLSFHKQDGAVTTASAVQVREPAHTRSIGRWRRYERQLEPMRVALEKQGIETQEY